MPGRRPARRAGWVAAVLTVVPGLAVTACSHGLPNPVGPATGSAHGASSSPSATPAASTRAHAKSSSQPQAPLTGSPAASAAAANRPAVALAIAGSDPWGLNSADVVFEEFAAPVRYVAVYQSRQADSAGPITGTEPSDVQILTVLHPLIGYDGAKAPFFIGALDKSKVTDAGFGGHASPYTSTPQGLAASTSAISQAVRGSGAPPPLFRYRGADSGADTLAANGVSRASSVRLTIPGNGTQDWAFDSHADRWKLTSGGPKAQAANLVIQTVSYKEIGINRAYGVIVQNAQVVGTGRAEVLSGSTSGDGGGTAAAGTWSKPHLGAVTNYFDDKGFPMAFDAGPTWIILAPSGTQISTSGR
jgi:hypothetical protein